MCYTIPHQSNRTKVANMKFRTLVKAAIAALFFSQTMSAAVPKHTTAFVLSPENGFEAKPLSGSVISGDGNVFSVKAAGSTSGICFNGNWDFSAYRAISFVIENRDAVHPIYLCCDIFDSRSPKKQFSGRTNKAVRGVFEAVYEVRPLERLRLEFALPPEMPHPEVNDAFSLMRGTPYSHALNLFSYDLDLSDVRHIAISAVKGYKDMEYVISDVSFLPGKRRIPAVMKMDRGQFFPFVDRYGQYMHADWKGKIHSDKDLEKARISEEKELADNPGPVEWNRWGGWANGPKFEATGQFRVQKVDGKWWMIDPDGCLFWSHGVVRVTSSCCVTPLDDRKFYFEALPADESDPFSLFYHTFDPLLRPYYTARGIRETYDFSSANAFRKYGEDYKDIYADIAHRRCRSWGINTMANSSDPEICAMDRTVYNERVDLGAPVPGYPEWPVLEGSGGWWPFIDPFDSSFPLCVRAHLEAKIEQLRDPWCLGFYVDNEIRWGNQANFASLALKASPKQASKMVLIDALVAKYKGIEALNKAWGSSFADWNALLANRKALPKKADADLEQLTLLIVRQYFRVVRDVFKQVAPDKLYMGCRFSSSPEFVVRIAADYVDVMSYNNYTFDRSDFRLPEGIDLPVVLGEFHFGAMDRGMFHPGQVTTNDQEGKGAAYEYYVRSCLENPCIIGTNWHQFSDQPCTGRFDGENFQVGLTDCCDTPYPETIKHVRNIGYNMYHIRYGK